MSLAELRMERDLLEPLIRDVVAAKQARIRGITREIARRESDEAGHENEANSKPGSIP